MVGQMIIVVRLDLIYEVFYFYFLCGNDNLTTTHRSLAFVGF